MTFSVHHLSAQVIALVTLALPTLVIAFAAGRIGPASSNRPSRMDLSMHRLASRIVAFVLVALPILVLALTVAPNGPLW